MVFAKGYNGRRIYNLGLSKKDQNGEYVNGYILAQFKKGVVLENKTKIEIEDAWLTFYINKDKKTIPYIFVNKFEGEQQNIPEGFAAWA